MSELLVQTDPALGVVVRKIARSGGEERRLERERRMLGAAQHPGVVELANRTPDDLVTRFAGSHTLETEPPRSLCEIASVVAAVSETLSDLHAMGIVHGRVEPSHVIRGDSGRPVLCGFGGAAYVGATVPVSDPRPPELTDPRLSSATLADPTVDVFGVGAILRLLLEEEDAADRRDGSSAIGVLSQVRLRRVRRAMAAIAAQATGPEAERPSAKELAATLRALAGRLQGGRAHANDPMDHDTRARTMTMVCGSVGLALLAAGLWSLVRGGDETRYLRSIPSAPQSGDPVQTTADSGRNPSPTTAGPQDCGSGCVESVTLQDGIIRVGADRFAVGEPGDAVVLGDWDCDGVATPAVLRTSSGSVYRFERWPDGGDTLSAARIGTAAGANRLRTTAGTCPTLVAVGPNGAAIEIIP